MTMKRIASAFIFFTIIFSAGCSKDNGSSGDNGPGRIVTGSATRLEQTSAVLSGYAYLSKSGKNAGFGIVYSMEAEPSPENGEVLFASGVDANKMFSVSAEALDPGTLYRFRAFIIYKGELTYGEIKSFSTLSPAPEPAPAGWLELPGPIEGSDLHIVRHYMDLDGETVRNWTCCYSYTDLISYWVAYPLNTGYIGDWVKRTDAWGYDPEVPEAYQYDITFGYGGYDRGHQLPSADRYGSWERNASTFYSTNMTPQKATFNQKTWAYLEALVRDWATSYSCDTMYVVTGAVRGTSVTRAGVNIPSAYFKALLRLAKTTSMGHEGFNGIAFWYDHTEWGDVDAPITKDMAISISTLEEKLGYTLFPNLDDAIGKTEAQAAKSEDPQKISLWGLPDA